MNSKKIRICHITSAHPSSDMRIFQKECKSLAQNKNYEVFLVAQGESRKEGGVTVIGTGNCKQGRLRRMTEGTRKVYQKAVCLNADIYQLHDPELLLYANKLKSKGGIVIFDSHEDYPAQIAEKEYLPWIFRNMIAQIYKKYETYVVRKIDGTVIPGSDEGINRFEGISSRTVRIDNSPIMDQRRCYTENRTIMENEPVKVCYVGGLNNERGITKLVEACYRADAQLILAGNFITKEYEQEIMNKKEAECIDYRGFCNYDEISRIYEEADIGAATLLKVGQYATMRNLPTKVYEYMQVGLPVMMSNTDYNKKLMANNDFAYLVEPDDVAAMAEKIQYIANNYSEAKRKAELGYTLIQQKYNWNIEYEKLESLYKLLLKEKFGDSYEEYRKKI